MAPAGHWAVLASAGGLLESPTGEPRRPWGFDRSHATWIHSFLTSPNMAYQTSAHLLAIWIIPSVGSEGHHPDHLTFVQTDQSTCSTDPATPGLRALSGTTAH